MDVLASESEKILASWKSNDFGACRSRTKNSPPSYPGPVKKIQKNSVKIESAPSKLLNSHQVSPTGTPPATSEKDYLPALVNDKAPVLPSLASLQFPSSSSYSSSISAPASSSSSSSSSSSYASSAPLGPASNHQKYSQPQPQPPPSRFYSAPSSEPRTTAPRSGHMSPTSSTYASSRSTHYSHQPPPPSRHINGPTPPAYANPNYRPQNPPAAGYGYHHIEHPYQSMRNAGFLPPTIQSPAPRPRSSYGSEPAYRYSEAPRGYPEPPRAPVYHHTQQSLPSQSYSSAPRSYGSYPPHPSSSYQSHAVHRSPAQHDPSGASSRNPPPTNSSRIMLQNIKMPKKTHSRSKLPDEATSILKQWLVGHWAHPYPTEEEKIRLEKETNLTLSQISNWFTNARRRLMPKINAAGADPTSIHTMG